MVMNHPPRAGAPVVFLTAGELLPGDMVLSQNKACYLVISRVADGVSDPTDGWGPTGRPLVVLALLRVGKPSFAELLTFDVPSALSLSARRYASNEYELLSRVWRP
jgi:hypothetical protein